MLSSGGTFSDEVFALALDTQGAATVAGRTSSTDFPTTPGAFDTTYNGGFADAFIVRLSPSGSISSSTGNSTAAT